MPNRCLLSACAAALLLGFARAPVAETLRSPVSPAVFTADLRDPHMRLLFQGTSHGLWLSSLRNLATGHEYVRPPDASPTGDVEPSLASPFVVGVTRGGKRSLFTAARDLTVTRWTASPQTLKVEFSVQGLFIDGEFSVMLGQSHSYWECRLRNFSAEPAQFDFVFPAFVGLAGLDSPRERLVMPREAGSVTAPGGANLSVAYAGDLASPCGLLAGHGEGLFFVDNNRADMDRTPLSCYQRSILSRSHWDGFPAPALPAVGLCNRVYLASGASISLGPIIVGTYRGSRSYAVQKVAQLRQLVVPGRKPSAWLSTRPVLVRANGAPDATGPAAGSVMVLRNYAADRADYTRFAASAGGATGLPHAIEAVHRAGGRVILAVDGLYVKQDSPLGRTQAARDMALRDSDRSYPGEKEGLWTMCPAEPEWRHWLAGTCARLLRLTGADGIEITSLCREANHPCFNPNHHHPTPFVWNWGVRQLLEEVRTAIDAVNPQAVLLIDGDTDLAREFTDGAIVQAPPGPDLTGLRAVLGHEQLYTEAATAGVSGGARVTADLAFGVGTVILPGHSLPKVSMSAGLVAQLPQILGGDLLPNAPVAGVDSVTGHLFAGRRYLLVLGNSGPQPFDGLVRLPYRIGAAVSVAGAGEVLPDSSNRIRVALAPDSAGAWLLLPGPLRSASAPGPVAQVH